MSPWKRHLFLGDNAETSGPAARQQQSSAELSDTFLVTLLDVSFDIIKQTGSA